MSSNVNFEKFTDKARKALGLARKIAQERNHAFIGPEHFLLGVLESGGRSNALFSYFGILPSQVRQATIEFMQNGPYTSTGQLPFTHRAKLVLEKACDISILLIHKHVTTEHLVLGLLAEKEGIAAQVLTNLGLTFEATQKAVIELSGTPKELPEMPFITYWKQYREGQQGIADFFGLPKGFEFWDWPFEDHTDEEWAIRYSNIWFGEFPEGETDATFREEVIAEYKGESHTLVLMRGGCGPPGAGGIFLNSKRRK